jgi:arsenate reductase (thioredoxin)
VLVLCRNNSCRSQMAEGFLRALAPESFDVFSAGSKPTSLHPLAVQVMGEAAVDISGQKSKNVSVFEGRSFDFVITVCKEDTCPVYTGDAGQRLAWIFDDPAVASGTEEEVLEAFRGVKNAIELEIRCFIGRYA